ncbi:MAG: OsmC family protein [Elusimicrobia bacterium]|nr:OsmC family protein [Elusimicrobiota bacterium]
MIAPFPHQYKTQLEWTSDRSGTITAGPRTIVGGPPPDFDGSDEWWNPEQLLLASASLCLMTTFMAMTSKYPLKPRAFICRAEGTLDKTPLGLAFTSIILRVELRVAVNEIERADRLIENAKKYCIISNSLKTPVTLEATVVAD